MKKTFTTQLSIILFTLTLGAQENKEISNDSLFKYIVSLKNEVNELKKHKPKSQPYFSYKNGLGFSTPDSSYSVNIRFRMQNRFLMNTKDEEHLETGS